MVYLCIVKLWFRACVQEFSFDSVKLRTENKNIVDRMSQQQGRILYCMETDVECQDVLSIEINMRKAILSQT